MRVRIPVAERLVRHSEQTMGGCLVWTGSVSSTTGYASMTIQTPNGPKSQLVHRVAYETHVGAIPTGLTVDHLCRNKLCINVEHMEIVTRAENVRRRDGASSDECRNGHRYTEANTRPRNDWRGVRICRSCEAAATRRYQAKRAQVSA